MAVNDAPPQDPATSPPLARSLLAFALRVVRGFFANGGEAMASAIAYNGLLSMLPLCLLATAIFARFVDRARFLDVVGRELRLLIPSSTAKPVLDALVAAIEVPYTGGVVGFATLVVFSTLAFRTLQHAMDVIFEHRHQAHKRRPLPVSLLISVGFVLAVGLASLLQALTLVSMRAIPGLADKLPAWSGVFGLVGVAFVLAAIYWVMPPGKGSVRTALLGGALAALALRGVQAVLVWYLQNVSAVGVIYGSLAAVIVVLFSIEIGAIVVLLGAQVISELEQSAHAGRRWYEPGDEAARKRSRK